MNQVTVNLQRLIQILFVLLVGLTAVFFSILFGTRQLVNDQVRAQIGPIATEASGLFIEVGEVRGDWWSGLTLKDVKVHDTEQPTSGVLATVPRVQVEYSVLSLLGPRERAVRIDAYSPDARVVVGKDHLMRFKPKQKPMVPLAKPLPAIEIVIHGGRVAWEDLGARRPFTAEVDHITGRGMLKGTDLDLSLQALRDADPIHARVRYSLKTFQGHVDAKATGLAMPYFVNRFGWAPEYELTGGKADVDVQVAWQDPLDVKMTGVTLGGTVRIRDGSATIKNTERPVEHLAGLVTLDAQNATLKDVTGDIDGMPLEATGRVTRLMEPRPTNMPDPLMRVSITAPAVALEKLGDLFPGMKPLNLRGEGVIRARVTGPSTDPRVVMEGVVPSGFYGQEPVHDFFIAAHYKKGEVAIPRWRLFAAKGRGEGDAWVGLPEDPKALVPYRVAGRLAGLDVADLLGRYTAKSQPVPLTGRLGLSFRCAGVGARAETTAEAAVMGGKLADRPLGTLKARYHAANGRWEWPAIDLAWGATALHARASGTDAGTFEATATVPGAELAALAALSPTPLAMPVTGRATATATLKGRTDRPATWTGSATLALDGLHVGRQPLEHAQARFTLADDTVSIADGVAHALGGRLAFTGSVAGLTAKDGPTTHLHLEARGLDASAVADRPRDLRPVQAVADGRFDVTADRTGWHATGAATARRLTHPTWGHLDALEATLSADPTGVTLAPLTWRQGAERVTAEGRVSLGPRPTLDLRVRAQDAEVATLLSAADWRHVEAALNPRLAAPRTEGPEKARAELPGREVFDLEGPTRLRAGLDHWMAWRKLPLDRPAPAPALLPFWEGTRGKLTLDAHLTGPLDAPQAAVSAHFARLEVFARRLDDAEIAFGWRPGRLTLDRLRLVEGGHTVLTGGGAFSDRPGDALVLATHDLDLGWTRRVLDPMRQRLNGHATVTLRLRGPWKAPRLEADGALANGAFVAHGLDPIAFERIDARLAFEHGVLAIRRASLRQDGKEATVTGTVPMGEGDRPSSAPLDLAVRLEDGNLGIVNLFSQERFRWLGGKGFAEIRLGGTALHPTLAGQIKLADGRFTAKGLEAPVENVEADVVLSDDRVLLKALHGHYGGGDVDLFGEVALDQFKPDRINLTAVARPFRLQLTNDYYQGMVEANLRLTGSVAQPQLSGLVALKDGVLRLKDDAKKDAGPPKEPIPLRLQGLEIALGPNLRLKNAMADVAIATAPRTGPLRVDGPLTAPQPSGVVLLESGTIRPLNNPFKIVEGKVEFHGEQVRTEDDLLDLLAPESGDDPTANLNAKLDVQARTTVYDYKENEPVNIQANVTGSLQKMEMRFTAEPMRSEQQILDMLSKKQVLSQTFNGTLDGGQVIVKEVGGLVSSNIEELISPYTLALRNALSLQTFRVELVPDYNNASTASVAGFKPALTLETRPFFDRLSLGSRLVAGQMYSTSPTAMLADRTYFGLNMKLNRFVSLQYRVDPVIDQANERVLNQTLGFKAQVSY